MLSYKHLSHRKYLATLSFTGLRLLSSSPSNGPDQILPASSHKTTKIDVPVSLYNPNPSNPVTPKPISVHSLFKGIATDFGKKNALAVKRDSDVWKYWTYSEYFEDSRTVAKAFIKLGLDKFHGVCILGFNSPEWFMAHMGSIFASGISTGVYGTNSPRACANIAISSRAQILVVENDFYLKKFLAKKDSLPPIKAIVQWSGTPKEPGVLSWAELLEIGREESDGHLEDRLSKAAVNQCCTLIFTSGTTGAPKGVMCSQDQFTFCSTSMNGFYELGRGASDIRMISYLPLCHLAGLLNDAYLNLSAAGCMYFANPDALHATNSSLGATLVEIQPTHFFGVPRLWEKMHEKIQEISQQAGDRQRAIGAWAKAQGYNYYQSIRHNKKLSTYDTMKYSVAKSLVHNKLKKAIGLLHAKRVGSGSAPISVEVLEYFASMGIPVLELYGLSECSTLCTGSKFMPGFYQLGSVGRVFPITEVSLKDFKEKREGEGEICIKGRNVFMGYLDMPNETDETIDDDGWLHTGDIGYFDNEKFLHITGRLKELIITSGGVNIAPVQIESRIKSFLPFVSNAILIGDKRKYLTIMLTLKANFDGESGMPLDELTHACARQMRMLKCRAWKVSEVKKHLSENPEGRLAKKIQKAIDIHNAEATSNVHNVQKWIILDRDFTLATEELNNTLKLRRSFVHEKYADVIDAMYAS